MKLYVVHDEDFCYRVIVSANTGIEAKEKGIKWMKENHPFAYLGTFVATLCDNDVIIE